MEGECFTGKSITEFGNDDLMINNDENFEIQLNHTERSIKNENLVNVKVKENQEVNHNNDTQEMEDPNSQTFEKIETQQVITDVTSQNKKSEIKKVKIDHAQLDELLNENVKKIHICKLCKETFKKKKKLKKHMKLIHGIVKSKKEKSDKDKFDSNDKPSTQKLKNENDFEIHEETKSKDNSHVIMAGGMKSLEPNKRKRKKINNVILNENIESNGATDTSVTDEDSINNPPKKKRKLTSKVKTAGESSPKIDEETSLDLPSNDPPVVNSLESFHQDLKNEVQQTTSARIFTPKKAQWECKICNESFDKKKNLTLHMKTHSNKSTTETPKTVPDQKVAAEKAAVKNVAAKKVAAKKGATEEVAAQKVSAEKELISPKLAAAQKAFVCKLCFMTFEKQKDLDKHSEETHKKELDAEYDIEKKFVCEVCEARFKKKWTLQNHMMTHTGEKPYECDICDAKFTRMEGKLAHMVIHTGKKPYKCTVCQAAFNQKGNLNSHMAIHSGKKPFKCSFCEASFISRTSMKEHMMLHTGEKLFRCDICNLKFLTEVRYKKHLEVHTSGEKPYKCDICFATFVLRLSFTQHMKRNIHNGDTEYKCPYCDLELTSDKRYNNHIRKHEEPDKKFKCDECFAEFGMKAALARHKQMHTGERPYKCELCNASFAQSNSLKVHQRLHAGDTPFKCDICDVTFYTKSAHSVHMKSHNISFDTGSFQVSNFRFSEAIGLNLVERMKILQDGMEGKSDEDKEKRMREEIDKLVEESYESVMKKVMERNAEYSDTETLHRANDKQEDLNDNQSENPNDMQDTEEEIGENDKEMSVESGENAVDLKVENDCENITKSQLMPGDTVVNDKMYPASGIKEEPVSIEKDVLKKKSPNKTTSPRKGFNIDSLIMRKMKPSEVQNGVESLYSSEMDRLSESLK